MEFAERKQQTQIKHLILKQYLDSWTGIIFQGILGFKRKNPKKIINLHFNYIDLFSYKGYYSSDECADGNVNGALIPGSPPLGIESLKKIQIEGRKNQVSTSYNGILVELVESNIEHLKWGLQEFSHYGNIEVITKCRNIKPNQIYIIQGNCIDHVDDLTRFMDSQICFTFVLIDPYGLKDIPMEMVLKFVNHDKTDTMINFPLLDIYRKSGYLFNQGDSSLAESNLQNIDSMYGSAQWRELVNREMYRDDHENATKEMEEVFTGIYTNTLLENCPEKAVKTISLKIPQRDRIMYNLVLTTNDPSGTMEMNRILRDAELEQYYLDERNKLFKMVEKEKNNSQVSMFSADQVYGTNLEVAKPEKFKIPAKNMGEVIYEQYRGKTVTMKELYKYFGFNSGYNTSEIKSGLSYLKREKLVNYDNIRRNRDVIRFE